MLARVCWLQDPPSGSARGGGQHTRDIFVHKDAVQASGECWHVHSSTHDADASDDPPLCFPTAGLTKFEKDQRLIFDIVIREGRDVAVNLEKA